MQCDILTKDPIAEKLKWLDGVFTSPDNPVLFHDERQRAIEKEFSSRWIKENRLGLLNGLAERFGEEAVLAVIDKIISHYYYKGWEEIGKKAGNTLESLLKLIWEPMIGAGFEYTYKKRGRETRFRVTRCPLYDMAKELGAEKWLYHLACLTDEPTVTGFNKNIRFSRSQTLMKGHPVCNHTYTDLSK
jgi:predicted ArsR family transcriptional regulator